MFLNSRKLLIFLVSLFFLLLVITLRSAFVYAETINEIKIDRYRGAKPSKYVFILDDSPPYYRIINDGYIISMGHYPYSVYTYGTICPRKVLHVSDHDISFNTTKGTANTFVVCSLFIYPTVLVDGEKIRLNGMKDNMAFTHTFITKGDNTRIFSSIRNYGVVTELDGRLVRMTNVDKNTYEIPYSRTSNSSREKLKASVNPYNPVVLAEKIVTKKIAGTVKEKKKWVLYPKFVLGRAENDQGRKMLENYYRGKSASWFEKMQWYSKQGSDFSIKGYADISGKFLSAKIAKENQKKKLEELKKLFSTSSAPYLRKLSQPYSKSFYLNQESVEYFQLPYSSIKVEIEPIKNFRGYTKSAVIKVSFGDKIEEREIYPSSDFHHFSFPFGNNGKSVQFTYYSNRDAKFKATVH